MIASRSEGKRKGLTYLCQSRAPRTPSWPTDMRDLPYGIIAILLCGTPGLISPILRLDNTFFFLLECGAHSLLSLVLLFGGWIIVYKADQPDEILKQFKPPSVSVVTPKMLLICSQELPLTVTSIFVGLFLNLAIFINIDPIE